MYGEKIKDMRDLKNIKQKEIAKILNISNTLYCDYENENQIIPIKYLNTISSYFGVSIDYIFSFNNNKKYSKSKSDINQDISGIRLKEIRKENKLTQVKLADYLKIANSMLSEYEKGHYIISTHALYQICKKYKVSADYLLGKIDEPKYLK